MSGETSDISQFHELEWFKWVMFWDEIAPFPDDVLKLGHYLGPSIDVGPVMTTKILTQNGKVLYRSKYKLLTPDEIADKMGQMPKSSSWPESMKVWSPGSYPES